MTHWTRLATLLIAAATAIVAACGGGGNGEAGVGTGGSGYAVGTVTGFGSIIVDGVRWDERAARIQVESDPASGTVPATVKLGQRVKIEYETEPEARVIEVEAAAVGPVQSLDSSGPRPSLRVAGQVVQVNLDFDAGPVTVFEGYASAAGIAPGDIVEVHGVPIARGNTYALQASRIERRNALAGGLVRVQNVVQQFDAAARTLRLGDITVNIAAASVLPAGATLSNGRTVTVWGRPLAGAGTTLMADFVRLRDLPRSASAPTPPAHPHPPTPPDPPTPPGQPTPPDPPSPPGQPTPPDPPSPPTTTSPIELSGNVTGWDAVARTFDLGGVRVDASGASVVPGNLAIANGSFVVARGLVLPDGTLAATQVRIRKKGITPGFESEVTLAGPISDFVSLADFRVRGVRVDASRATQRACSGNNVTIGNGLDVEVGGAIGGDKIVAELLVCR